MATLEEIKKKIKNDKCIWCGTKLDLDKLRMRPHENGWVVDGMSERQYLSIRCSKCDAILSLCKLGVPKE